MEIPGVKAGRARQLIKAGFRSLKSLANVKPEDLVKEIENLQHKVAIQIVSAAKVVNKRVNGLFLALKRSRFSYSK